MAVASEHHLLLRHFESWAQSKGTRVDTELLARLLDLRATYDDMPATYWPSGTVEDLLLRLWPAKGDIAPPDEESVVDTLAAYFRFLRSTGRMSGRSATPAELVKETRRNVRRMPEVASDTSAWSPSKALLEYGRSIGIDVDAAPNVEALQQRMTEVNEAWNALPIHERRRRMPGLRDDPERPGAVQAMVSYGVDDPITALMLSMRYEYPGGELPPASRTARRVREAPYMQTIVALCDWIGDRVEITDTGVLRRAPAHEAYDVLGLRTWEIEREKRAYRDFVPAGVDLDQQQWIERIADRPWRNAGDCQALDRVWRGAVACAAVELHGKWVYRRLPQELDDEAWLALGVRSCIGLLEDWSENPYRAGVVYGLLRSYVLRRQPVSWEEILDFVADWFESAAERRWRWGDEETARRLDRRTLDSGFGAIADTGLVAEDDDGMALTDFGDVVVTAWLQYRLG